MLYFWEAGTHNSCLATIPGEERTPFFILPYDLRKAEERLALWAPVFRCPNGRLLKACSSFLLQGREREEVALQEEKVLWSSQIFHSKLLILSINRVALVLRSRSDLSQRTSSPCSYS